MTASLYRISATDPTTFGAVVVALLGLVAAAPGRRLPCAATGQAAPTVL